MSNEYEDVIERLREEGGFDEEVAVLERFSKGRLREAAARATDLEKERDALQAKLESIEGAEARQKAFVKYGIDFEQLSKLEKKALEGYDGELTDEAIGQFVEENELPLRESAEETDEETEGGAETIARTAQRAGANGGRAPMVTPSDTESWSTQRLMEFREKHPEEFEALKRGETVTGVTG